MRSPSKMIAFAAAAALVGSSTVAAAAPAPQPPATQAQAPSAWMMLSALGPTRAIALGGAAAAQPADVPPGPPPGPPVMAGGLGVSGEIIGFIVMFALIAIALGISGPSGRPNSPR